MRRNVKAILMSGQLWQDMMTIGWEAGRDGIVKCTKGLPKGAVFRQAFYKEWSSFEVAPELVLIFEHPDFDEVPEGEPIPYLPVEHAYEKRNCMWPFGYDVVVNDSQTEIEIHFGPGFDDG